jgi:hypothetical protein
LILRGLAQFFARAQATARRDISINQQVRGTGDLLDRTIGLKAIV